MNGWPLQEDDLGMIGPKYYVDDLKHDRPPRGG